MHDPKEILEICSRATEGPWVRYSQDHIAELLRDFATCKQRTDDLYNEPRRLDDENAKLRAVAEAANSLATGKAASPALATDSHTRRNVFVSRGICYMAPLPPPDMGVIEL